MVLRESEAWMLGLMQGWLHSILYVLFENAMSVVKLWAVIAGAPCLHQTLRFALFCLHAILPGWDFHVAAP